MEEDALVRLSLRLTREQHEALSTAAAKAGRSLNADVVERLAESLLAQSRAETDREKLPFSGVIRKSLLMRIDRFSQDQVMNNRVEAVEKLLSEALQARETVEDLLHQLKSAWKQRRDLRVLARDVLSTHSQVTTIRINEAELSFAMTNNDAGAITKSGQLKKGTESDGYLNLSDWMSNPLASGGGATSSWEPSNSDLDDEIPF